MPMVWRIETKHELFGLYAGDFCISRKNILVIHVQPGISQLYFSKTILLLPVFVLSTRRFSGSPKALYTQTNNLFLQVRPNFFTDHTIDIGLDQTSWSIVINRVRNANLLRIRHAQILKCFFLSQT